MQGTWQYVHTGLLKDKALKEEPSAEMLKKMRAVVAGNMLTLSSGRKIKQYDLEINQFQSRQRMNLTSKDNKETIFGIFTFNENNLIILLNDSKNSEYPAGFDTKIPMTFMMYEKIKTP